MITRHNERTFAMSVYLSARVKLPPDQYLFASAWDEANKRTNICLFMNPLISSSLTIGDAKQEDICTFFLAIIVSTSGNLVHGVSMKGNNTAVSMRAAYSLIM